MIYNTAIQELDRLLALIKQSKIINLGAIFLCFTIYG